jgi:hypothetical protein
MGQCGITQKKECNKKEVGGEGPTHNFNKKKVRNHDGV